MGGTVIYMPPERYEASRGRRADVKHDMYRWDVNTLQLVITNVFHSREIVGLVSIQMVSGLWMNQQWEDFIALLLSNEEWQE